MTEDHNNTLESARRTLLPGFLVGLVNELEARLVLLTHKVLVSLSVAP